MWRIQRFCVYLLWKNEIRHTNSLSFFCYISAQWLLKYLNEQARTSYLRCNCLIKFCCSFHLRFSCVWTSLFNCMDVMVFDIDRVSPLHAHLINYNHRQTPHSIRNSEHIQQYRNTTINSYNNDDDKPEEMKFHCNSCTAHALAYFALAPSPPLYPHLSIPHHIHTYVRSHFRLFYFFIPSMRYGDWRLWQSLASRQWPSSRSRVSVLFVFVQ